MNDKELIRKGDALDAAPHCSFCDWQEAIAALPAVKVDALTALYLMRDLLPPVDLDEPIEGDVALEPVTQPTHAVTVRQTEGAWIAHDTTRDIMAQGHTALEAWERLAVLVAVEAYGAPLEPVTQPAPDAYDRCGACGSDVTDMDGHIVHEEGCEGEQDGDPQPAPDALAGVLSQVRAAEENLDEGYDETARLILQAVLTEHGTAEEAERFSDSTTPAPTCLHLTAEMARDCPVCTPSPLHAPTTDARLRAATAQLDAGAIREASLREAAAACEYVIKNIDILKADGETYETPRVQKIARGLVDVARQDILALITEKPHDRA